MAELRWERVPIPDKGLSAAHPPSRMPAGYAPVLTNWLVQDTGRLVLRGPIFKEDYSQPASLDAKRMIGGEVNSDKVLFGERASGGGTIEPWQANQVVVKTAADLASATVDLARYVMPSVPPSSLDVPTEFVAVSVEKAPGPQSVSVGRFAYALGYDGGSTVTNRFGGLEKVRKLIHWNGTAADTGIYVYGNSPKASQDIAFHYQRLFVLGGIEPGKTTPLEPNVLYFSDPIDPTAEMPDALSAWQDDTSGLINKIHIDESNDVGVALAKVGQHLLILRRHSCYQLYGYSPSTFTLRRVSDEHGVLDPRAVAEYEGTVFFVSDQGLIQYDGSEFINVSGTAKPVLVRALSRVDFGLETGSQVTCEYVGDGYLMVIVAKIGFTDLAGTTVTYFEALYDIRRGSWNLFDSQIIMSPLAVGRANGVPYLLSQDGVSTCRYITNPWRLDLWQGSVSDGFATEYDQRVNGEYRAIPATWESRFLSLGSPGQRVQLQRLYVDARYSTGSGLNPLPEGELGVELFLDGERVAPRTKIPLSGSPRTQYLRDVFHETGHAQLRVELTVGAGGIGGIPYKLSEPLQIYDAAVEYQVSHRIPGR